MVRDLHFVLALVRVFDTACLRSVLGARRVVASYLALSVLVCGRERLLHLHGGVLCFELLSAVFV